MERHAPPVFRRDAVLSLRCERYPATVSPSFAACSCLESAPSSTSSPSASHSRLSLSRFFLFCPTLWYWRSCSRQHRFSFWPLLIVHLYLSAPSPPGDVYGGTLMRSMGDGEHSGTPPKPPAAARARGPGLRFRRGSRAERSRTAAGNKENVPLAHMGA